MPEKSRKATNAGLFGFAFKENSVREIDNSGFMDLKATFSTCLNFPTLYESEKTEFSNFNLWKSVLEELLFCDGLLQQA